jgi:hypothetical protein
MKTKNLKKSAAELQEETFRAKVDHYLVCFMDDCPLHEQCLRWQVGQYVNANLPAYNAVNPRNPKNGGEECVMYRPSRRVLMKRGFTNMYHEMPGYMEHRIRKALIKEFGHKRYFEMRKGDRLVTPEQQQLITATCRHYGWQGTIVYDGEQEEWAW